MLLAVLLLKYPLEVDPNLSTAGLGSLEVCRYELTDGVESLSLDLFKVIKLALLLSIGLASRDFSLAVEILLYAEIVDLGSAGLGSLDLEYESDMEGLLGVTGLGSLDLSLLLVILLEYERVTVTDSLALSFKLEYDLVIGTDSFAFSFMYRLLIASE